jgi:hypothetical protein
MMSRPSVAGADDAKLECIQAATDGQTLRRNEKLLDARQQMLLCSRPVCPEIVRTHCARWLAEIEQSTPSLIVRAQDSTGADLPDAKLTVDGQAAPLGGKPLMLDPGNHVVVIEMTNGSRTETKVVLQPGELSRELVVQLPHSLPAPKPLAPSEAAPTPDGPVRTAAFHDRAAGRIPAGAWILAGVGAVGLGLGGYFYYQANNQFSQLLQACSPHCTVQQTAEGRNDLAVSQVSFVAGGAALAAAIVWALVARASGGDSAYEPRLLVRPVAGGNSAGIGLTF